MVVELLIEDERWHEVRLEAISIAGLKETLNFFGESIDGFSIDVLACDDQRITKLNSKFRGEKLPTNVLSWPTANFKLKRRADKPDFNFDNLDGFLGDIAISYDTCAREAEERNIDFLDHISHLIIHSILHLLGYDHAFEAEEEIMTKIETEILGKMGIDSPYI